MFEDINKMNEYNENAKKRLARLKAVHEIKDKGYKHTDAQKAIDDYLELNSETDPIKLYLDLSDICLEGGEQGEFREILEYLLKIAEKNGNHELAQEIKERISIENDRN